MNIQIAIGLSLLLALAGCNKINICHHDLGICEVRTQKTPPPPPPPANMPKVSVVELDAQARHCSCGNGRQFALRNSGGYGNVSWTTLSREPADVALKSTRHSQTMGKDDIPLACTIELTEVTHLCEKSTVTLFDGQPYGGDVNAIMQGVVVATAKADLQSMQKLPAPRGTCPQMCRSGTDCLQMDARTAVSVDVGRQIAAAFVQPKAVIPNSFIVGLSAAKSNVCNRSDIVFEGSRAYNFGLSESQSDVCQISTNLPSNLGDLGITIPRTVSFFHSPLVGDNFSLQFEYQDASPKLAFGNDTLDTVYGGRVLSATYDAGNFVFEMEAMHRCLAVRVN